MADTIFLEFEIHLRDEARVLELQGNPPGETSTQGSGATAQKAIIRAPGGAGANVEFAGDNGGVTLPLIAAFGQIPVPTTGAYIYSRWFQAGNPEWGAMFPVDVATFVKKSGGWFGIPFLFGNTKRFYWRGVFVYDPPLDDADPGDPGTIRQVCMKRRWIDPGPANMFPNREGFGVSEMSRDAGAWVDTLGYRSSEQPFARDMIMTEWTGGLADQARGSWERLYLRLRKTGSSSLVWRCGGTVDASHNAQINMTPSGQLAVFNAGVLVGTTEALEVDRIYKVDITFLFGDGGAGFAPQDHSGGGAFPGARFNLFLDGVSALSFTPAPGVGLGNTSFHLKSRIGCSAATETAIFDIGFWMNAQNPIVFNGIDFLNGSRAVLLRPKAFTAGHLNWTGDYRLLSQYPMLFQHTSPIVVEGLTSTTALAELQAETDADKGFLMPGSIGVAGIVVCSLGHRGTTSGQFGYKAGAAARVMATFGVAGIVDEDGTQDLPKHARFMYAPKNQFPVDPATILPFEIHRVKGNDATIARTYQLMAVAEVIGIFHDSDYPAALDPDLKYPIPQRGYHNAPYPRSPWAQQQSPPFAPVVIKSGTYVGNGLGIDLEFPAPVHWLWIRKATGAGNPTMARWWSSMTAMSLGGMKQPQGWLVPNEDIDPTYDSGNVEDVAAMRFRVRIAGGNLETNRTGDTYHFQAVCDPGMRFLLNSAMGNGAAFLPLTQNLILASFTPLAALIQEQRQGNYLSREMFFKGPGHAATAMNRLDTTGANVNGFALGAGTVTMQAAFGAETPKYAALALMRSDDGSGDVGRYGVFGFGSYVGNGGGARDIVHTVPGVSGKRPMWILVAPNGAQGYVKDCQMPATTAFAVGNGVISTTAITGAAINQFTIGATLNTNAVTYHYMIIWGSTVAGNGGMSECGEIWPVDPDPPDCIKVWDPTTGQFIDPPGGCDPGDPEPPEIPPETPPGGDPPGGPGGGPDDIASDLSNECVPFTTRVFNDALSRIGISKRIQFLTVPTPTVWSATTAYVVRDAVTSGGSTYYCILAHTNQVPPNATFWTLTPPAVDNTEEADLCKQHYARSLEATLRDFPWPFSTRYATLALLAGSTASPVNRDWTYSYRQPSDCVFERRLAVLRDGAVDPTPPPFQLSYDNTLVDGRILTNQQNAQLEYTARPLCSAGIGDPLFLDALTWRLASRIAGPLTRIADVGKMCLEQYNEKIAKAFEVVRPGNPGPRTTVDPNLLDTAAGAGAANVAVVNRGLIRIGAKTIRDFATEQSRECEAARLLFEEELRSVLRDYPWAFATRYVQPALVAGTVTVPANADWTYAYRTPTDSVKIRRISASGTLPGFRRSRDERDPEMHRQGSDATGGLLFAHVETPTVEYTARIADCVLRSDALFRDAFAWRLAASLAPSLATVDPGETEQLGRGVQDRPRERKPTEAQLRERAAAHAWRQYYLTIEKARLADAGEQQQDSRDTDADWIKGRE